MPKLVDHDARRLHLVKVTWRVIAREGIDGATMREIATRAGFANGALKPYFGSKDELLAASFQHVFNLTNERTEQSTAGLRGVEALRAFCHEVLPLDEQRILEARIVIPFWQKALTDPDKAQQHEQDMNQWRAQMLGYLQQARDDGGITRQLDDIQVVRHLLSTTMGAQIMAVLYPAEFSPAQQVEALEAYLEMLRQAPPE
ncbi:TetR/AcrR family transcriptional regulator [Arthrobacter castelli]|uniref:TetR/AcrR family transcriptional regulator n=1 Tax=Arthrobacter castelli TaxID=271431 RepID=UPI0003FE9601|nr:TetR/AcrR family transcriptional regulator [Arthrobacter castelli]